MNWHRTGLILLFDLRYSVLKSKGLFFIIPFLLFWLLILYNLDENVISKLQSIEVFTATSAWLNVEIAKKLFLEHPPVLSAFLIISFMTAPVFMLLAGNDQFSSDLADGYYRFLSTRCKRLEIFLGKYLSSLCLVSISLIIAGSCCLAFSLYYEEYSFSVVSVYFFQIILILVLYHACLLSYTAIISATIKSPLGSLLLAGVGYAALLFIGFVGNTMHGNTEVFSYILPGSLKPFLLDIGSPTALGATLSLPAYIIVYGLVAWTIFKRRNF